MPCAPTLDAALALIGWGNNTDAHDAELPDGWTAGWDEELDSAYFKHTATGDISYQKPGPALVVLPGGFAPPASRSPQ